MIGGPPLPPQVHVCFSFFEKIIFCPSYICLVFFVLSNIDICYVMQGTIEPLVLEEHQCKVVADPPLPPRQVHVCFAFFENIIFRPCSIYVLFSFYYLKLTYVTLCRLQVRHRCLKSTKSLLLVTHLWPPTMYVYVSFYFNCAFNDSTCTFLIIWNCLIVSLCFCT